MDEFPFVLDWKEVRLKNNVFFLQNNVVNHAFRTELAIMVI